MDRKRLEALVGQEVAVVGRRPRNRAPSWADRRTLVAVGVAGRGRWGTAPAREGDDKPGSGPLMLLRDQDGREERRPSREVYCSWAEWEEHERREEERRARNLSRLAEEEAERDALAQRLRAAMDALGITGGARVLEREYLGHLPVRITDGAALVALLERIAADRRADV